MKDTKEFFKSSRYLLSIARKDGIRSQFIIPNEKIEIKKYNDPLNEADFTKTKGLIHRYPDRVVLTVTNRCFAYCRFCFRKKNWFDFDGFDLDGAVEYIKSRKSVREVLVSGGDPFFLTDKKLEEILRKIRSIKHVEVIRIGTRVISSNPLRIDKTTVEMLKKYKPVWIAAHINHPDEITDEFRNAADMIINAGIPMVSQTVLLKNINDEVEILKKLFCRLVYIGIKPYYLFGCDMATGNENFRVPIKNALSIMEKLRGATSGLCVPTFSFDLPEGGGKIVLEPQKLIGKKDNTYTFINFEGREYDYEDV